MKNRIKKFIPLLSVVFTMFLVMSCNKDKETADIGRITYYPVIEILGDKTVILDQSESDEYVDAGVKILLNGSEVPATIDGEVDLSVPGVYFITYSAVNEDGFSASDVRTVVVVDPKARAVDLTGSYARGAATSNWVKVQDCVYTANNPGGVPNNPPFDVKFTIYNIKPGIVNVPEQQSGALSSFSCVSSLETLNPDIIFNDTAKVGETAYSWYCNGPNFGPALRIFKKL
jgi:hypothetical protein